jgi:ABC-type transport system substrate-binding protein
LQPVFTKDGTLNNAEYNRNPTVGCGPYVLDKWESGSYARFVANDKYWLGKPKIDQIFFRFVPDDASQIAALKNGDGDLGTFITYSDMPALEQLGINIQMAFSGYNEGMYFYLDPVKGNPALQDQRVREAIVLAINRDKLDKDLLLGKTVPAATDWDNTPYVDPSIKPYPFDPDQAKKLLDEAGWKVGADGVREKDGKKLEITYGTTTREIRKDVQAVTQQELTDVGIKVNLMNYASDLFFSGFDKNGPAATGQLDMFEYSAAPTGFPDPDVAEWLCTEMPNKDKPTGTNWMQNCDKDLDKLFQDQATQVDFKTRQQTFYQITKMIYDKVYWFGLWQDPDAWAIGKRLQNVKISGVTPFFNIMEWDLTQ